jgi:hypothetical protein
MFHRIPKIRQKAFLKYLAPAEIIGMTSQQELAFLHYYASKKYTGAGEIVDLGCWLGATTFALAKGLELNRKVNQDKRIHAFDLFYWQSSLDQHIIGTPYENQFLPNDDYKWLFLKNTKKYEQKIVTVGEIIHEKWDGKPIEFLFIDAMKNIPISQVILQNFYPYLLAGKSLVVYQDFDHYYTPWIHLLIYRYRNYFSFVCDIKPCGSIVFKLLKPIPQELIHTNLSDFYGNEADEAISYTLQFASKSKYANIAAAHIMFYYYKNNMDTAKKLYYDYINKGFNPNSDLQIVKQLLFDLHD